MFALSTHWIVWSLLLHHKVAYTDQYIFKTRKNPSFKFIQMQRRFIKHFLSLSSTSSFRLTSPLSLPPRYTVKVHRNHLSTRFSCPSVPLGDTVVPECQHGVPLSGPCSKAGRNWHVWSSHVMSTQFYKYQLRLREHRRLANITYPGIRRMRIQVPLQHNPSLAGSGEASRDNPEPTPLCLAHPTHIQALKLTHKDNCMDSLATAWIPFLIFKESGNEGFDVYF